MPNRCHVEPIERRLLLASLQVLNADDGGVGSLRAAIASAANSGDTIDLTGLAGQTITLASELVVNKSLTFAGPGAASLTISGDAHATRAFNVTNATVSFKNLTIAHAGTPGAGGGAILSANANLSLDHVVFDDDLATNFGGAIDATGGQLIAADSRFTGNIARGNASNPVGAGGALFMKNAPLFVARSTFDNNVAEVDGSATASGSSAAAFGGAVMLQGNAAATSSIGTSTFVNNVARVTGSGGSMNAAYNAVGGAVIAALTAGGLDVTETTIARNVASATMTTATSFQRGGGLAAEIVHTTLSVRRSILADNVATTDADLRFGNVNASSVDGSVIGASDGYLYASTNRAGTAAHPLDARLGLFGDHGGATPTLALLPYSPAINLVAFNASAADQRGVARQGNADAGAYEYVTTAPTFTSTPTTAAAEAVAYDYELAASDADGDALAFTSIALPVWLTLVDHGDGTATLAGTPTSANVGANAVRITVGDGAFAPEQSFTITVTAAPTPDPDPTPTPDPAPTPDPTPTPAPTPPVVPVVVPPAVSLVDGKLSVLGSDAGDVIHIWTRNGTQVRVVRNGTIRNFDRASVTSIDVDAGGGDDDVAVNVDTLGGDVYGGSGNDTIVGGDGDDTLGGGGGNDVIRGRAGRDVLRGHGGQDQLFGDGNDDRLYGGDGKDTLEGGTGADRLWGGAGRDVYRVGGDPRWADRVYASDDGLTPSDDVAFADARDAIVGLIDRRRA